MDEFSRRPTVWTNKPAEPQKDDTKDVARSAPQPSAQPRAGVTAKPRPVFTADTRSNTHSQTITATSQNHHAKRSKRMPIVGAIVFLIIIAGAGAAAVLFWPKTQPTHFSAVLKKSVSFPLYYPVTPAAGYTVDQSSLANQKTSQQVYFVLKNGSHSINISEQAKPSNAIVATVFERNLVGPVNTATPYGEATVGVFSGRVAASLMTDKTWIIVSATPDVTSDMVSATMKGLQLDQ